MDLDLFSKVRKLFYRLRLLGVYQRLSVYYYSVLHNLVFVLGHWQDDKWQVPRRISIWLEGHEMQIHHRCANHSIGNGALHRPSWKMAGIGARWLAAWPPQSRSGEDPTSSVHHPSKIQFIGMIHESSGYGGVRSMYGVWVLPWVVAVLCMEYAHS